MPCSTVEVEGELDGLHVHCCAPKSASAGLSSSCNAPVLLLQSLCMRQFALFVSLQVELQVEHAAGIGY